MRSFFRSIKFRVWLRFEAIVLVMLVFTYIFLVALFPRFYELMKIREVDDVFSIIKSSWSVPRRQVEEIISRQAAEKKMYIEAVFQDGHTIRADNIGGNVSYVMRDRESFIKSVSESETGTLYKQVPIENEDNSLQMMGSFIGGTKENPMCYIFIFSYLQPVGTTLQIFMRQFYFVGVALMVITIFISAFFAENVSEPIIRMSSAAKNLPKGQFDVKIGKHDYGEIKQLAGTLTDASKEIAKSDDLRRELMSNISHDLRTPLTMIKAYAEMIRDLSGDNPEKRSKHLKVIIDETDRLSSLVTDILDLSKLQAGVTELNLETFNFSDRLSGVVSRFDIIKEKDGISVDLSAEPDMIITADKTKLEQVVYNLINNAVTYAGEDNLVLVRLYKTERNTARFEVQDHGEGISSENLPYIWDRYYKVSEVQKTHKRAKMGSGIGLSIVKNVLELHEFEFGAQSEQGRGSTFWFEAPIFTDRAPEQLKSSGKLFFGKHRQN